MVLGEGVAAHVASGMILVQGHTPVVETYQGSKNLGCPRMRYRPGVYCYREGCGSGGGSGVGLGPLPRGLEWDGGLKLHAKLLDPTPQ